jgi:SHS family lactate transporter-like MFS transporter
MPSGFTLPMLIVTTVFLLIFVVALLLGPETKGKILVSDIELRHAPQAAGEVTV